MLPFPHMATLSAELEQLVPTIRAWARAHSQVGRLWLFGSRVKGSHRPDSDLDIAVGVAALLETDEEQERFRAMLDTGSSELSVICGLRVSLQAVATPGVDKGVEECGVLIYEIAA